MAAPPAQAKAKRSGLIKGSGTQQGGFFVAGADGATFSVAGGGSLELQPGASIRMVPTPMQLMLDAGKTTRTRVLVIKRGRVDVKMPPPKKGEKRAVMVRTTRRLAGILKHGHMAVLMNASSASVANFRGDTMSALGSRWTKLPKGSARTLDSNNPGADVRPLMTAPTLEPGQRAWMSVGGAAQPGGFSWKPITGATRYAVSLHKQANALPSETLLTSSTKLNKHFNAMAPGLYWITVRGINRAGLEGLASNPEQINIVGAELPAGAFATSPGTIELGPGQRARLTHVDGLRMSYGKAAHDVSAATEVGLFRSQKTTVVLRHPSARESVLLKLVPRQVYADVKVGPKTAVWPTDPIKVSIRLKGRSGAQVPDNIDAVARVSLGVTPLKVSWTRKNGAMHATIPPQKGKGPWVVRVEVEDQFGIPLGRDFVEVVAKPKPKRPPARSPNRRAAR